MRCDRSRELISALLDGEGIGPGDELRVHLETCAACRSWAAEARSLHRSVRLQPAPRVPDLTRAILARSVEAEQPEPSRGVSRLGALRVVLGLVAASQLVVAAPELLNRTAEHGHVTRHLGGWDVAFSIGLLVAAVQPWRARGLLPMATAVAGVMLVTGGIDAVSGGTPGMAEATHLLEVCGVAVLWAISRAELPGSRGDGGARRPQWTRPRRVDRGWPSASGWARAGGRPAMPVAAPQMSAAPSCVDTSLSASSRITASRARATRDRTVPMGQSQTSAVSA
jgi:predicted anti-sigma-YlaC factor YlaD